MKIDPVTLHNKFIKNNLNVVNITTESNYHKKSQEKKTELPIVSAKLALISFYGDKKIKPSSRLENSDYKIFHCIFTNKRLFYPISRRITFRNRKSAPSEPKNRCRTR